MIDLEVLEEEYKDYKIIKSLYDKYKKSLKSFTNENSEEIEESLKVYNSILNTKNIIELENKLLDLKENDPVFADWLDINNCVEFYENELNSRKTYACADCDKVVEVVSDHTGEKYLVDIITGEIFDLESFSKNKQNYILDDLNRHELLLGTINSKDLPFIKILRDETENNDELLDKIVCYDKKLIKKK